MFDSKRKRNLIHSLGRMWKHVSKADMSDIGLTMQDLPLLVMRCLIAYVYMVYLCFVQIYYYFKPQKGKSLKDKHVLITGAGGALGRELALRFAQEGCRLSLVDVNLSAVEETAALVSRVSPKVRSARLDVTARADVAKYAVTLLKEAGPLDILVNNAGIVQAGGILDVTDQQIIDIMEVNLMGQFWMVRAFLPSMVERNSGHIVAISSAAALSVASNIAPYSASKAGVSAFMGCMREELRKKNSNVMTTTVQPFFLAPPKDKKHWEVKSVLPDITAEMAAASTVRAVKRDTVTLTLPTYMFFLMHLVRLVPAKASDMWRDAFAANIDSLRDDKRIGDRKMTDKKSTDSSSSAAKAAVSL